MLDLFQMRQEMEDLRAFDLLSVGQNERGAK